MESSHLATDEFSALSIDELKELLRAKDAELQAANVELQSAKAEAQSYRLMIENLKLQILKLKRMQFGQRSEKRERKIEQLELLVEELETREEKSNDSLGRPATQDVEKPPDDTSTTPKRRRELPAHLPREIRMIEPKSCLCSECGKKLVPFGEDVCEFLDLEPLRFKVVRQVRPKLACSGCDVIVQEPAPSRPIERGMVGPGLLAHILVGKYADHTPLYRQAEIYAREGVELDRSLLAQWVGGASRLLEPLVDALHRHVFSSEILHTDDTPLPVLDPGRGKTKTARLWTYVRDERPAAGTVAPAVWFAYSPDRKGEHPQKHLQKFSGVMHADGYAGYMKVYDNARVTEAACWAHTRRKFVDLHELHQSSVAKEVLDRIGGLYEIEAEIRGKTASERCEHRQRRSKPLLDAIHAWMEETLPHFSQKSATAQAIRYALVRWKALTQYCEDGRIEIDNNAAERALRCVALGRKNFLFAGSDSGGAYAAGLYSLIGTAKLNGQNPEAYLRDILAKISDYPISQIADLLPWNLCASQPMA